MISPFLESASERRFISSLQAPIPIDETIHEQLCRGGSVGLWESSSTLVVSNNSALVLDFGFCSKGGIDQSSQLFERGIPL